MIKSYNIGVDYFMSKPTTKKQLLYALNTVLEESKVKIHELWYLAITGLLYHVLVDYYLIKI